MEKKQINFEMPMETYKRFRELSNVTGISISFILRQSVDNWIKETEDLRADLKKTVKKSTKG